MLLNTPETCSKHDYLRLVPRSRFLLAEIFNWLIFNTIVVWWVDQGRENMINLSWLSSGNLAIIFFYIQL